MIQISKLAKCLKRVTEEKKHILEVQLPEIILTTQNIFEIHHLLDLWIYEPDLNDNLWTKVFKAVTDMSIIN